MRLYHALLEQLSHGYEQGILSNDLYFNDLLSQHSKSRGWDRLDACQGESCRVCQQTCRHFPLGQVLSLNSRTEMYFPEKIGDIGPNIRIKWIQKRQDGGSAVLVANQQELWKDLFAMNSNVGSRSSPGQILIHFDDAVLDAMAKLKEYGCDPGCVFIMETYPFDLSRKTIA